MLAFVICRSRDQERNLGVSTVFHGTGLNDARLMAGTPGTRDCHEPPPVLMILYDRQKIL